MNIEHISVSRKKSFDQCAYYYKLKYHLKVPNPEEEKFHFIYGKIVHKIAETYVEENGTKHINEITKSVLSGDIEIEDGKKAPKLTKEYQQKLPIHIQSLMKLNDKVGATGIVEYKFKYDLDPPNQKYILGFIDRLIINDGKALIIDYKTTKKGPFRVSKSTVLKDLQLRTYARVVNKDFGIAPENIKCALYYFEDSEIVAATYNEEALIEAETDLLKSYNKIQGMHPDEVWAKVGSHCKFCEYKTLCPFYKNSLPRVQHWDGNMDNL